MKDSMNNYAKRFSSGYNLLTKQYIVTGYDVERLILWRSKRINTNELRETDKTAIKKDMNNKKSRIARIMIELGLEFRGNTIIVDKNNNVLYDMKNFRVLDNLNKKNKKNKKRTIKTILLTVGCFALINIISPLNEAENLAEYYLAEGNSKTNSSDDIIAKKRQSVQIIVNSKEANPKDASHSDEKIEEKGEENQLSEDFEEDQTNEAQLEGDFEENQINENQTEENFEEDENNENTKIYYNSPHYDFSAENKRIIEEKKYELTEDNMKKVLKDYDNNIIEYIKGFGGIFEEFLEKNKCDINTAGDFQFVCEIILSILATLGPDYLNKSSDEYIHWGKDVDDEASRFYNEDKYEGVSDKDDITSALKKAIININCSTGVNLILNSIGLKELENPIKITKEEDLQVGDIIYFKLEKNKGIGHEAIVGEIDEENGEVVIYDTGRRFIQSGNYKMKLSRDYEKYKYWYAKRKYEINPSKEITIRFKNKTMNDTENDR